MHRTSARRSRPSLADVAELQNRERNLRRLAAARGFYGTAKRVHVLGAALAIILALSSPLVLLLKPSLGPMLGAVAGAWIFVSRILFEPVKRHQQRQGASAQEAFDCDVLGIEWNTALVRRVSEEETRKASGEIRHADKLRSWYPTDNQLAWPDSVLLCQRSNAVWARRQHRAYGWVLAGGALGWFCIGVAVAVCLRATLAQYLTTVLLPSLPAVLDAAELSRRHIEEAGSRQVLEDQIDAFLHDGGTESADIREIQDQLFALRSGAPQVAGWFYRLMRSDYEEDMKYAARLAARACADESGETHGEDGQRGI
jgi:hypothetical protein